MSIILITHIIAFSLSLVLTATTLGQSALGKRVATRLSRLNMAVTAYGVTSGAILVLSNPLGAHCALLFGYVAFFGAANAYISRRNNQLVATES